MKQLFLAILLFSGLAASSQCDTMTSATFTAITTNSVNVSFTVSGSNWSSFNVTLYDSVTSAVVFNNASLSATSFTATGLSANKVYRLRTYTNVPFGGCEPYVLFPAFRTLGNIGYTPMNGNGYLYKRIAVDSTFHVPLQDTGLYKGILRAGALVQRPQDSTLFAWNGLKWDGYAKKDYVDTKPTFGDVRDIVSDSVTSLKASPNFTGTAKFDTVSIKVDSTFTTKAIYVIGDSYGVGYGLATNRWAYSIIAPALLGNTVTNFAQSGATVISPNPGTGSSTMALQVASLPAYNSANDDYVIVALGLNDVRWNGVTTDTASYRSAKNTQLSAILAKGWPANRVLIISPWHVTPTSYVSLSGNPAATQARHLQFVSIDSSLAASKGMKYFDSYNSIRYTMANTAMLSDSIHYNKEAHLATANGIVSALGYTVKSNGQQLAVNNLSEFQKIRFRNSDTLTSQTFYPALVDSAGNLVRGSNQFIYNNPYAPQGANININGTLSAPVLAAPTIAAQTLTASTKGIIAGYLQVGSGSYPALKKYLLMTSLNTAGGYIDAFDSLGVGRTLNIGTQSAATLVGNTSAPTVITGSTIALNNPATAVSFTNYVPFTNGISAQGYPGSRSYTSLGWFSGAGYLDAQSAAGAAAQLNIQVFGGGGNTNFGGTVTIPSITNYLPLTTGLSARGYPGTRSFTSLGWFSGAGYLDAQDASGNPATLNLNVFGGGGAIVLGGNTSISANRTLTLPPTTTGTAGTDSILIKTSTGVVRAVSPSFYATSSSAAFGGQASATLTAATTVTVTIGATQANTNYEVNVTPTNATAATHNYYVTNKTTTTFDVVWVNNVTGTVTFDWILKP